MQLTINKHRKSLKLNMVLNTIKSIMGILFPLITFPYASRILEVENIGKYNFCVSIISYFVLLAGLGVSSYAIREGAKIKNDQNKLFAFCSDMVVIEIISSLFSYCVFLVLLISVEKLSDYAILLLILSAQILFKMIDVEWIYSIFEDYTFITIRSICIQIISFIALFLFVHTSKDLIIYTLLTTLSNVGIIGINWVFSKNYFKIRFVKTRKLKQHLKPIFIFFAISIATTIFVNSDTTVLGFLADNYHVGLYSVSVKVYTVVKTLLSSVIVVSIPRLSALLGKHDMEGFNKVAQNIYKTLITFIIPAIVGICILRKEIILTISGDAYIEAASSLVILAFALLFSLGSWFWGHCILVPVGKENVVFKATAASAITNLILNFVLIPFGAENAAAFTTVIAEALSFLWSRKEAIKCVKKFDITSLIIKVIIGCVGLLVIALLIKGLKLNKILSTILITIFGGIIYFIIELVLKNEMVIDFLIPLLKRVNMNYYGN